MSIRFHIKFGPGYFCGRSEAGYLFSNDIREAFLFERGAARATILELRGAGLDGQAVGFDDEDVLPLLDVPLVSYEVRPYVSEATCAVA